MARLPHAAKSLIHQVQTERPSATYKSAAEPDGLRVVRTIRFDKRTSAWLAPLLEVLDDSRIEEFHTTDSGYLHVTFVHTPEADRTSPWPLSAAETVAESR